MRKSAAFSVLGMFVLVMSMGAMAQEQPVVLKSTDSAGQNEWARVEVTNSTAAGAGNPAYVRLPRLADASAGATLRNSALLELQSAYWTGSTTGNYSFLLQAIPTATSPAAKLSFLTRDNAGTEVERLVLTHTGNLGLGTSTPACPVDVAVSSASMDRGINISHSGAATTGYGASITKTGAGTTNYGLYVTEGGASTTNIAVAALTDANGGFGLYGINTSSGTGSQIGCFGGKTGNTGSAQGFGLYGSASGTGLCNYGVMAAASGATVNYAGFFVGDVYVAGTLSKSAGTFVIDHPLDPDNKILRHSFVESPEMKNVYDGVVVLDKDGKATIILPTYFEALNKDFRYQLTPIGKFAQLYVADEVNGNKFAVAAVEGSKAAGIKVSWQVTGVRKDAYALAHPVVVEEAKGPANGFKAGKSILDASMEQLPDTSKPVKDKEGMK